MSPATAAQPAEMAELAASRYAARDVTGHFTATWSGQTQSDTYEGRLHYSIRGGKARPRRLLSGAPEANTLVVTGPGAIDLSETGTFAEHDPSDTDAC